MCHIISMELYTSSKAVFTKKRTMALDTFETFKSLLRKSFLLQHSGGREGSIPQLDITTKFVLMAQALVSSPKGMSARELVPPLTWEVRRSGHKGMRVGELPPTATALGRISSREHSGAVIWA